MRRTIIAVALLLGFVGSAQAGAPPLLETQGVLYDSEGAPADALVSLAFTLYDGREGASVWTEIQDVAVTGGVFSAVLGAQEATPFPADLFSAHDELWLGVQVAAEAELPRQRLVSVAFALEAAHAALADVALSLDCVGCVGAEQLAMTPASQADLEALTGRVVDLEAAVAGLAGPRLATLDCGGGAVPRFDGTDWTCETGLATQADLDAIAVDSVDGLLGGTIGSATTVAGTLSATTILQDGHVVCDASGNCGQTLAGLACTPDQFVKFEGGAWSCADVPQPGVPTSPCVGDGKALQWDGAAWVCVDTKRAGLSRGAANGFEVSDDWALVWDGIERGAATWDDAQAACVAAGARLPTPTELWRNNAGTGTGQLGTTADASYLWTLITASDGDKVTVRLSDGTVSNSVATATLPYRCVWTAFSSDAFAGDYCNGPKGEGCVPVRRWYHMDAEDRAPLDYVAASHECNFYNASIPTIEDWTEAIQAGDLEGSYQWQWSTGAMYYNSGGRLLIPVVRFDDASAPHFAYSYRNNGQLASWSWPYNGAQFRCIGKRSAAVGVDPVAPACEGGCFTVRPSDAQTPDHAGRRAPIWADGADRAAASLTDAAATCEGLGGSLPTLIEAQELIHAGWALGSDAWLWTASPIYHGSYQTLLVKWAESGVTNWYPSYSGWTTWDNAGTSTYAYRCVWHQTLQATPHTCAAGQAPTLAGTTFGCVAVTDGADAGQATGGGFTDAWGNRWDAAPRDAVSYTAAVETCEVLGGRLPTASEVWRVKGDAETPLPDAVAAYTWTTLPSYRLDYATTIRESDGLVSDNSKDPTATALQLRCIWPSSHGNVLGGRACNGDPGTAGAPADTCLRLGRTTIDPQDRAPLYVVAAETECRMAGGWLTDHRSLSRLIHAGLPNGNGTTYTWMMDAGGSSNSYWLLVARWTDTGDPTWWWNNQVTATGSSNWPDVNNTTFRCVFDDTLW